RGKGATRQVHAGGDGRSALAHGRCRGSHGAETPREPRAMLSSERDLRQRTPGPLEKTEKTLNFFVAATGGIRFLGAERKGNSKTAHQRARYWGQRTCCRHKKPSITWPTGSNEPTLCGRLSGTVAARPGASGRPPRYACGRPMWTTRP